MIIKKDILLGVGVTEGTLIIKQYTKFVDDAVLDGTINTLCMGDYKGQRFNISNMIGPYNNPVVLYKSYLNI